MPETGTWWLTVLSCCGVSSLCLLLSRSQPSGLIEDACCGFEDVEQVNNDLFSSLHDIVATPYFRYHKVHPRNSEAFPEPVGTHDVWRPLARLGPLADHNIPISSAPAPTRFAYRVKRSICLGNARFGRRMAAA